MNLIDKDKLLKAVKKRYYTPSSIKLIESQKEVDAIPIKYIRKIVKGYVDVGMAIESNTLLALIEDWRKENASN